jgi:hypothetical protein
MPVSQGAAGNPGPKLAKKRNRITKKLEKKIKPF